MKKILEVNNISKEKILIVFNNVLSKWETNLSFVEEKNQIIVECKNDEFLDDVVDDVILEIKKEDSFALIKEVKEGVNKRKVLFLEYLDCAHCAQNLEDLLRKNINADFVMVDFISKKVIVETKDEDLYNNLSKVITPFTKMIDPRIVVMEMDKKVKKQNKIVIDPIRKRNFIIGCLLFIVVWISKNVFLATQDFKEDVKTILFYCLVYIPYIVAYVLLAGDVLLSAVKNIKNGRFFDEKFLMFIATVTALFIGYYDEAMFVMIFYKLGELFQQYAVNYSRKSIASLIDIKAQIARIERDGVIIEIDPEDAILGDIMWVKPGERVALDGIIEDGSAWLDTSCLTGESEFVAAKKGDKILSGTINIDGNLKIKVKKLYSESMVSKILNLVENASSLKSKSENFITKFAKYYTPIVVVLAILVAFLLPLVHPNYIYTWNGDSFHAGLKESIFTAMIFLVVSCPCALVISVPLGFFGGIGSAGKRGVLVKGSNYLESLNFVDTIVFDKTGTLTKGRFVVTKVKACAGFSEDEVLEYMAHTEAVSTHPIARSITEYYGKENINLNRIKLDSMESGKGVSCIVDDKHVILGKEDFLKSYKVKIQKVQENGLVNYISIDGIYAGYIVLKDEIKDEAKKAIADLKKMGIKNICMFTGDSKIVAEEVSSKLKIDKFYANMTPIEKVKRLNKFKLKTMKGRKVCFVGDGINDAPVLNSADVSIAMGALGSDAAIEGADIVLMDDDLTKIKTAIKIARKTRKIVIENIILALVIKFTVLLLPLFFPKNNFLILEAIFADVGVSLIAIVNSMRAMRYSKKEK